MQPEKAIRQVTIKRRYCVVSFFDLGPTQSYDDLQQAIQIAEQRDSRDHGHGNIVIPVDSYYETFVPPPNAKLSR